MYEIIKKNRQNKSPSNNKVPAKERHDTRRYFGLELLQDIRNSQDSAPSDFYSFPKLRSQLSDRQFGNNPCCGGAIGLPGYGRLP